MSRRRAEAPEEDGQEAAARLRIDKWLWAARFFKTRALAAEAVELGRVKIGGQACKPGRELRIEDRLQIRESGWTREVIVRGVSSMRGPAPQARLLYEETPESLAAREAAMQARQHAADPAWSQEAGRPTKRDRRQIEQTTGWNRWSASLDDD